MKQPGFKTVLPFALRAIVIGCLVGSAAYWVFVDKGVYVGLAELCVWLGILAWGGVEWMLYRRVQPRELVVEFNESEGYWTYKIEEPLPNPFDPKTIRICIATRREKDKLPVPTRKFGMQLVGKIHCVVEDRFWVWQETLPWAETEGGVLVHPSVR